MSEKSNEYEKALADLVHFLAYGKTVTDDEGRKWVEKGLDRQRMHNFLNAYISDKEMTVIEALRREGRSFVNELIEYVNRREST